MIKLFTVLRHTDVDAVLRGERRLSDVLPVPEENEEGRWRLEGSPTVPRDLESATVEVSFPGEEDFLPFMLQIMDGPDTYALPRELIDSGTIRMLSDAETMVVAREMLQYCLPPSSTRLWEYVENTAHGEREEKYGHYLARAFVELEIQTGKSVSTDFTVEDRALLLRLKVFAAKSGYTPVALLLAGETQAEFQQFAQIPILGPFPHTIDEAPIGGETLATWPDWVAGLVPEGSKWQRLHWPDGSITIRLVDHWDNVLAAKQVKTPL